MGEFAQNCVSKMKEGVSVHSLFLSAAMGGFINFGVQGLLLIIHSQKYLVKFLFQVQILSEFNIAQRLIGPRPSYLKKYY